MKTWNDKQNLLAALGLAVATLLFLSAGALLADDEAGSEPVIKTTILPSGSQPSTAAASEPVTPGIAPLPTAANVEAGLKFDDDERKILSAVHASSSQIDENGLYVLLRRAAALPQLDQKQFEELNRISTPTLADDPARFRGTPLRLKMKVFIAKKWLPGKDFQRAMRWPKERPVWWLGGFDITNGVNAKEIIVISVTDPMEMLGKPSGVDSGGRSKYGPLGKDFDVAGIFYNVVTQDTYGGPKEEPKPQEFPVFVAWQLIPPPSISVFDAFNTAAPIAIIMVVLIFLFFFMRKRNKSRLPVGKRNYRPLRDDPDADATEVTDPALKEAAEQFKKQKPKDS